MLAPVDTVLRCGVAAHLGPRGHVQARQHALQHGRAHLRPAPPTPHARCAHGGQRSRPRSRGHLRGGLGRQRHGREVRVEGHPTAVDPVLQAGGHDSINTGRDKGGSHERSGWEPIQETRSSERLERSNVLAGFSPSRPRLGVRLTLTGQSQAPSSAKPPLEATAYLLPVLMMASAVLCGTNGRSGWPSRHRRRFAVKGGPWIRVRAGKDVSTVRNGKSMPFKMQENSTAGRHCDDPPRSAAKEE